MSDEIKEEAKNLAAIVVPMPSGVFEEDAKRFLAVANSYTIDCAEMKPIAVSDIQKIMARWDEFEAARKKMKVPVDEIAKQIQEFFVPKQLILMKAKEIIRNKLDAFINEEERIAREAQEAARKATEEQARVLKEQAKKMEGEGRVEEARAVEQAAEMLPALATMSVAEVAKTSGTARKTTWTANCTDKIALMKACTPQDDVIAFIEKIIAQPDRNEMVRLLQTAIVVLRKCGQVPHQVFEVNESFLNSQAKALKGEMNYPGVQVKENKASSFSRK